MRTGCGRTRIAPEGALPKPAPPGTLPKGKDKVEIDLQGLRECFD
jgi:hypothetical protein